MTPLEDIEDVERRLALVYAPAGVRIPLATLWLLDQRLGTAVRRASEPMIGAIRLAWWREALEKLDRGTAPAEPMLHAVAEHLLPRGLTGGSLSELEQGWANLLESLPDEAALDCYARDRGGRLFSLSAQLLCVPLPDLGTEAGEAWALADLAAFARDPRVVRRARELGLRRRLPPRWPARLRALGVLTVLARRDLVRENAEPRGSPKRVARAVWHRVSGR